MQGTKVIRVNPEGLKKLDKLNAERPQDMSRADTFDYILRVFGEYQEVKTAPDNVAANIAQSREPVAQSPDALYAKRKEAERIREIELNRERELSPTRSKLYSITEVDKP